MKTICVADLHIDSGRNKFNAHRQAFLDFLDAFWQNPMIFDGDLLELWSCRIREIMEGPNRLVVNRIKEKFQKIVVPGNHDSDEDLLYCLFPDTQIQYFLEYDGWKIMHGYQVDPLLDSPPERWFVSAIDRWLSLSDIPMLNRLRDEAEDIHRDNQFLLDALEGKGNFITGHSHVAEDRGWLLNCGTWTEEKMPYVEIEDGRASLKYFG